MSAVAVPALAAPQAAALCNDSGEEAWPRDDPRMEFVRFYCYGVGLPCVCVLGVAGNLLNLVVLTRRNMRGPAYVYMRGYSAASLLAILFAIPFGLRVRVHREAGRWSSLPQAFYHAHLELFLGNACLGVGVMMLLALTVERYVSVCRPGRARALAGPPRLPVVVIPLLTFAAYMPTAFRWRLSACRDPATADLLYRRVANHLLEGSLLYDVYKVALELVFKVCPTLLLAALNLRIMLVYRRSCERRRRMTLCRSASSDHDDTRHFAEERRLVLLLGSTSILFLVCVSPMVILNVTLSQGNLSRFPYQVFRAVANLLEVTNYSLTFYIYCLFSEDFRATLLRTLRWPWGGEGAAVRGCGGRRGAGAAPGGGGGGGDSAGDKARPHGGPTPPTTTTTTTTNAAATAAAAAAAVATANGAAPNSSDHGPSKARSLWRRLCSCVAVKGYKMEAGRASV